MLHTSVKSLYLYEITFVVQQFDEIVFRNDRLSGDDVVAIGQYFDKWVFNAEIVTEQINGNDGQRDFFFSNLFGCFVIFAQISSETYYIIKMNGFLEFNQAVLSVVHQLLFQSQPYNPSGKKVKV